MLLTVTSLLEIQFWMTEKICGPRCFSIPAFANTPNRFTLSSNRANPIKSWCSFFLPVFCLVAPQPCWWFAFFRQCFSACGIKNMNATKYNVYALFVTLCTFCVWFFSVYSIRATESLQLFRCKQYNKWILYKVPIKCFAKQNKNKLIIVELGAMKFSQLGRVGDLAGTGFNWM